MIMVRARVPGPKVLLTVLAEEKAQRVARLGVCTSAGWLRRKESGNGVVKMAASASWLGTTMDLLRHPGLTTFLQWTYLHICRKRPHYMRVKK